MSSNEIRPLDSPEATVSVPPPTSTRSLLRKVFVGPHGLRAPWKVVIFALILFAVSLCLRPLGKLSGNVNPAALAITTTSLPNGVVGQPLPTGINILASGGSGTGYTFSCTLNCVPGLTLQASGAYTGTPTTAGTFSPTFQVTDSLSNTVTRVFSETIASQTVSGADNTYCAAGNVPSFGASDGPATLPQTCLYTARSGTSSPGTVRFVPSGSNVVGVVNAAACGDVIQLQAGGTFPQLAPLPAKGCDDNHWVTIETSGIASLPAEGTRISPCFAGFASLPGRPPYPCTNPQNVMAKVQTVFKFGRAIDFAPGADHYRFIGLEITRTTGAGGANGIVYELADTETSNKIIFDQVWMHGDDSALFGDETKSALFFNGANNVALIDSYVSDIYCVSGIGACTDAMAIGGAFVTSGTPPTPWGTYKVVNNYLEASGENILQGGNPPAGGTPKDYEIRRNYFFKPPIWNPNDTANYNGGFRGNPVAVKNLLELKQGNQMLIEGNVFENSWGGFSQVGPGFLLTPGGTQTPTTVLDMDRNITFRYNIIRKTSQPFQIGAATFDPLCNPCRSAGVANVSIHDVIADHIQWGLCGNSCSPYFNNIIIGADAPVTMTSHDFTFNHVTEILDNQLGTSQWVMAGPANGTPARMTNFTLKNSIFPAGDYGIQPQGAPWCGPIGTASSTPVITDCWGGTVLFEGNMIPWGTTNGGTWAQLGAGVANKLVADQNAAQYVNLAGGDYHLQATSPGHLAADDGTDIGANVDLVNSKTQCVTNPGNCTGPPQPLQIIACSPTNATVGTAYSYTCTASGGTPNYQWIEAGALPSGITFTSTGNQGVFAGTPAVASQGTYPLTISVTDAANTTQQVSVQLVVIATTTSVSISTQSVPGGAINTAFACFQFQAINGTTPYTWSITAGALPTGLTLSTSGQLCGTPTAAGSFTYTVQVRDNGGVTNTKQFTQQITSGMQFITGVTPGTGRTDACGPTLANCWLGYQINVGANALSVSSLCRRINAGNTLQHTIEVVQVGGAIIGSAAVVTLGGTVGTFTCTNLTTPITLNANTSYMVLSQEFQGGDIWYDSNTTVTTTTDASIPATAFSYDNVTFSLNAPAANTAIVPPGFTYGICTTCGGGGGGGGANSWVRVNTPSGASQIRSVDYALPFTFTLFPHAEQPAVIVEYGF